LAREVNPSARDPVVAAVEETVRADAKTGPEPLGEEYYEGLSKFSGLLSQASLADMGDSGPSGEPASGDSLDDTIHDTKTLKVAASAEIRRPSSVPPTLVYSVQDRFLHPQGSMRGMLPTIESRNSEESSLVCPPLPQGQESAKSSEYAAHLEQELSDALNGLVEKNLIETQNRRQDSAVSMDTMSTTFAVAQPATRVSAKIAPGAKSGLFENIRSSYPQHGMRRRGSESMVSSRSHTTSHTASASSSASVAASVAVSATPSAAVSGSTTPTDPADLSRSLALALPEMSEVPLRPVMPASSCPSPRHRRAQATPYPAAVAVALALASS
jgi:hypothetical protein